MSEITIKKLERVKKARVSYEVHSKYDDIFKVQLDSHERT